MPIPVVVVGVSPPGGGGGTPPPDGPEDPFTFARTVGTWTGGNGDLIYLTDCALGIDWQAGRSGTDMPKFDLGSSPNPAGHGSIPGPVRALDRTVILPTLIHMDRWEDWRSVQQRFLRALNPLDGAGELAISQPDGSTRYLTATYETGAEGQDIVDYRGLWFRKYPVQLHAFDPFWRGPELGPVHFGNVASAGFLTPPFLPLKLAQSQVLGTNVIDNQGDVETWPIWLAGGPFTVLTLRNDSTGQELTLNHPTLVGETVTIDTRPVIKSVKDGLGANLWPQLATNPQLWPLRPGFNTVTITATGSGPATFVDLLSRVPEYLSA